ncbi:MAG: molybdopterin-dependent oxidoreductase, partial [Adlercreutzia sp.]|nr:molybdopterin-dependent oxidoreductase [Adlercreutzia sp.]
AWVDSRGFFGGFINGMTQDAAPSIDVTLDQSITDHDDVFIVNNWGPEVSEKNGEPFSFDAVCSEENTVSLTGVKNPRSFTKAELEAMPQTEFTMALACATNGRGGSLVSNIPMSGVSVAYLIEQCGGLVDGVNAVNATGYDGWQAFPPMNLEASTYTENAYIALKYYGEDLSQDDGAPMTLVSLGNPGARQVKHIKSIDFTQDEAFFQGPMMAESDEPSPSYPINGMWFQEDGVTAKVGEPVTLTGAVYSWNRVVGDLASVNFSFDMGKTWQDVKIADQVTDFDPFQWVTYSLDWTPSKAGKYQVKLQATDANGVQMKKPVTLFVNVEE